MIINQHLATGGLWFNLNGTEFLVDPGPGCIVHTRNLKLEPEQLKAIIVSHRHLDHTADVNIMAEAITRGGHRSGGSLYAPNDALVTEPIILEYLKKRLNHVETLHAGGAYSFENVNFSTPVAHQHGVETYGFLFEHNKHSIAYITDTRYFDALIDNYKADVLMLNVVFTEKKELVRKDSKLPIDHLSVPEAEVLIKEINPKVAIMTHFGMAIWQANPTQVAAQMSANIGIPVIAARDGMNFKLSDLDE